MKNHNLLNTQTARSLRVEKSIYRKPLVRPAVLSFAVTVAVSTAVFAGWAYGEVREISQAQNSVASIPALKELSNNPVVANPAKNVFVLSSASPQNRQMEILDKKGQPKVLGLSVSAPSAQPAQTISAVTPELIETIEMIVKLYAASGNFGASNSNSVTAGQNGLVQNGNDITTGIVGGNPVVTYVPAAPAQGFGGTSISGFGQLSAENFSATNLAQVNKLNVTGASTFSGPTNFTGSAVFTGSTTISSLNITGFDPGLTLGSVFFQGASGFAQDNSNFFYDLANHRLGLGTTTPGQTLVVVGSSTITSLAAANCDLKATTSGGIYCGTDATGAGGGSSAFTVGNGLIYNATSTDFVGIGTTTPTQALSVVGNIYAYNQWGTGAQIPVLGNVPGDSAIMFWDANRAAFWAGEWDAGAGTVSTIGQSSAVFGYDNQATNYAAFAGGGFRNTASGYQSVVLGGQLNQTTYNNAAALGGHNNTASGADSGVMVGNNNSVSGNDSAVLGGSNNTNDGSRSVIVGGAGNTISGSGAAVIASDSSTASGGGSVVLGGSGNQATGNTSMVLGGNGNVAAGMFSMAMGSRMNVYGNNSIGINLADYSDALIATVTQASTLAIMNGNVGIGTVTPTTTLFVQGKGGIDPFVVASSTGTSLLSVASNGTVGVGTTTFGSYKLAVQGDLGVYGYGWVNSSVVGSVEFFGVQNDDNTNTSSDAAIYIQNGGANGGNPYLGFGVAGVQNWSVGIDNSDGDKFKITTADGVRSQARLTMTTDGKVGIGSTTPSATFFVQGGSGVDPFAIASSTGTQLVTVTQAGRVGIGTTTPVDKLTVVGGNIRSTGDVIAGLAGAASGVVQAESSGSSLVRMNPTALNFTIGQTSNAGRYLTLAANSNSIDMQGEGYIRFMPANSEVMRLTTTGNVGIGTTTPQARLHVVTASGTQMSLEDLFANGSGASGLKLTSPATGYPNIGGPSVGFYNGATGKQMWENGIDYRGGGNGAFTSGAYVLAYEYADAGASADRVAVKHLGQLSIGLPDAGLSQFTAQVEIRNQLASVPAMILYPSTTQTSDVFQIRTTNNGGASISVPSGAVDAANANAIVPVFKFIHPSAAGGNGNGTALDFIASSDGTTVGAEIASTRVATGGQGDIRFLTRNGSGLLERMRVDQNGNVGIGTTTPRSKLQIYPNASSTVGLIVQGDNNASTSVQEWQDASGQVLASVGNAISAFTEGGRGYINVYNPYADNVGSGFTFHSGQGNRYGLFSLDNGGNFTFRNWDNSGAVMQFQYPGDGAAKFVTPVGTTMYLDPNGNVGIGTTSPLAALHIGSATSTGNVRIAKGWLCVDDNDTCTGASTAGTIYATNGTVSGGADVAENYPTLDSTLSAGEIVAADGASPVHVTRATSTASMLGIVSTKPGVLLGGFEAEKFEGASTVPVALNGRVPVKVSGENGPVNIGDYLTLSKVHPGYAAKATYSTNVVGQALESFNGITGTILVFVKIGYENINNSFVLGSVDEQSPSSYLINQKGSGNLLQLQQNGEDRLLIANDGSMQILASKQYQNSCPDDGAVHPRGLPDCNNVLTVRNASSTLFTINVLGHITVSKDSAGTATVRAGDNRVEVSFAGEYQSVPKITASADEYAEFKIVNKTTHGFVIQLKDIAMADVHFDWVALMQPEETIYVSSLVVVNSPVVSPAPPPAENVDPPAPSEDTGTGTPVSESSSTSTEETIAVNP